MTIPSAIGYGWNAVAHRYYDLRSGVFVSKAKIAEGLQSMMDASALNMNALTQKLIDGQISLAGWQTGMMKEIKNVHVASAALSNGGWAQMTSSDWGFVGSEIKAQYQYLANYAKEIADGTQALDGRALVRSDLYADAANGTYWEMSKRSFSTDGYDEGRRILEAGADHCDDCLEYASEGWMPIDDIPEIGNSQCLTRCRCEIEFRKSTESE